MTGLLPLLGVTLAVSMLMWLAGIRGLLFAVAGVAMIVGAVAAQQIEEADREPVSVRQRPPVPSLAASRHAFTDRFTRSENWLAMADSMATRGNTADASGVLIAAVKQHPRDYTLWTGLGTMLTAHGGGLNPAAELAFERAIKLAPTYPMPRYFFGLAKLQSGDRQGALEQWRIVLATAPADASWRDLVEDRIRATEAAPD